MATYKSTNLKTRLILAVATLAVGFGVLELVAGGMRFPDPETMAVREQMIAMEAERAQQIRDLARGEVRYAGDAAATVR